MISPRSLWLCGAIFLCSDSVNAAEPLDLLARHCVTCHNSSDPKAGLDLSQAATALRGGDSGAVIVAGKPSESLLLERVADGSMPPEHDGRRLSEAEVATLKDWIAAGAKWPAEKRLSQFEFTTERRAGLDWWSLQPLPFAVSIPGNQSAATAVDAFIIERLNKAGLSPSPPADRPTLVRRATLDLLGLPPTPEEVAKFTSDNSPDAFEQLLDRLLASPHYGERWGRHWLDVVRYGESDGFEHDKYREHSWPYRDYVIKSLNADLPYSQFVIDQLAGDARPEASRESIAATGFLVAGPWDEIQNVGASPTEKRRAREEQQEELIAAVSQTFLGLTVHCARCHDHKFDPIPQADYYHLKAALDGVDHGNRSWQTAAEQQAFDRELQPLQAEIAKVKAEVVDLSRQLPGDARIERGAELPLVEGRFGKTFDPQQVTVAAPHSPSFQTTPFTIECWAKLDSKAGFNILVACNPKSSHDHWELYTFAGSGELSLYMPGCKPAEIRSGVNVVDGGWHYLAATVAESEVRLFVDGKLVKTTPIAREKQGGATGSLQFAALVDKSVGCQGLVDEVRLSRGLRKIDALPAEPFVADEATLGLWHFDEVVSETFRDHTRAADSKDSTELREQLAKLAERQKQLETEVKNRPRPQIYAGVRRQPEPTVLLLRGELSKPGPTVLPGAISAVRHIPGEWKWAAATPEAERRLKLAQWIAHPQNPLPWRVMANRIWQQHIGRGLVPTPSDFGFSGGQPSHPELLDHLALELRREGSWKTLHRRIMETNTYQQASVISDYASSQAAYAIDADNRLLWRFAPRRLEAETVRDAMLAVSGQLNRQHFGPSFKPFTVTVFNTHFYHLHDQDRGEFHRRTIYRAAVVTGRSPLLTALDCPAPSLSAPLRQATVTPLQALGLMNDSLVQRLATRLAERTERAKPHSVEQQVRELYILALNREPSAEELATGKSVALQHGSRELAWVLLNSSEFLYLRTDRHWRLQACRLNWAGKFLSPQDSRCFMISYNPHEWRSHLFDIRGSMLPEIIGRVTTCVVWASVLTAAHQLLPTIWPGFSLSTGATVHMLIGLALSLLLVFRTNASYDRFWEGRRLWGGMVNECRNLARQSDLLAAVPELQRRLVLWTASFPYAAMSVLRGSRHLAPCSRDLPAAELDEVLTAQHEPLAVSRKMTQTLIEARNQHVLSDMQFNAIDANINLLIDYIGACERIHRTPIPFAYMVHLRRALIFYCFTLPFALVEPLHWWTVPGVFLVAFIFFGIEEIGVEIEDPFGFDANDLPLERFCQTIEANLLAVLDPVTGDTPVADSEYDGD